MVRWQGKVMLAGLYEEAVSFSPNLLVIKAIQTSGLIEAGGGRSDQASY
jgi:hypothetical protein